MNTKHGLARVACAALLAVATLAPAADDSGKNEPPRSEQDSTARSERQQHDARMNEIGQCRERAHGMKGPERARFMTECLRSDRFEK